MLRALLMATLIISCSIEAQAAQILHVNNADLETLKAKISNFDSNRIQVSGQYIATVAGSNNGTVSIEKDDKQGQVFVRTEHSSKPFTLFLTTEKGKNYTIVLTPRPMPGQSIIIKPKLNESSKPKYNPIGVSKHVAHIKNLIKTIVSQDTPNQCQKNNIFIDIPWWDDTKLLLEKQYDCGEWIIDQYQLTNQKKDAITITEQEFFHDGVVSVTIDHPYHSNVMSLKQHESTIIWLVRDDHNE